MKRAEEYTNQEFLQLPFYERGYIHGSYPMAHSNETIQNLIQDTYKEDECADWLQGWLDGLGDINMLYEWEQYLTGEMTFDEWTNVCIETHKQITLVSGPPYPEHAAFLYNHAM